MTHNNNTTTTTTATATTTTTAATTTTTTSSTTTTTNTLPRVHVDERLPQPHGRLLEARAQKIIREKN